MTFKEWIKAYFLISFIYWGTLSAAFAVRDFNQPKEFFTASEAAAAVMHEEIPTTEEDKLYYLELLQD